MHGQENMKFCLHSCMMVNMKWLEKPWKICCNSIHLLVLHHLLWDDSSEAPCQVQPLVFKNHTSVNVWIMTRDSMTLQ